ncbi:MAG TPA: NAD(P)-dependent oxidoreductase [Gemmatimonadaceae bacterium]
MRVFVAGASGVIGRALVPRLAKAGHEVIGMSNDQSTSGLLRTLGAAPVVVDVFDRTELTTVVRREKPDAVIDELTSLGKGDYAATVRVREEGTRNLVDAATAAGVERFVAQSYCLYAPGSGLAGEDDPLDVSSDAYAGSIAGIIALERTVNAVAKGVILRYGTLYGPGTWYAPGGQVAGQLGRGEFVATDDVTSFIHVDDAAQAAVLALDWPKGTFNIVDDDPAPASVWAPFLATLVGAPPPRTTTSTPTTRRRGVSNAKARGEVAWRPIHPSWRDAFAHDFAAADDVQRRSA